MGNPAVLIGAITALIAAVTGAYFAWVKLRPETTNIQITSANVLTEIAVRAGQYVETQRDDLERKVDVLTARVDALTEALSAERAEKESVKQENVRLRARVQSLEVQVRELKAAADIAD